MTVETNELCACGCGRPKAPRRHWADSCYFRWYRAGKPKEGPPPPRSGKQLAAERSEEVHWLVSCGETVERAAERVGVATETAERYVNPPPPRPTCAKRDCQETATFRRWCDAHRDLRAAYEQARAAGKTRTGAAFDVGVNPITTYRWEPGRPGMGRPRKKAAA